MIDPFEGFQRGLMTGTQIGGRMRQQRQSREIGQRLQGGDYQGAAGYAFEQGDLQSGLALSQQASQQAAQQRQGQIVGALRGGQYDEALSFAQSPEELQAIAQFREQASEQERAQAAERAGNLAAVVEAVQTMPPEQRLAAAQQYAAQFGIDPSQVTEGSISPQSLEMLRARALGLKDYLEFKQDEREARQWRYVPQLGGFLPPEGFQPGGAPTSGQPASPPEYVDRLPPGVRPRPNRPSPASSAGGGSLIDALIQVESGGDPNAVSPKGARGRMQVMDYTNADPGFGVRPARDNSPAERERVGRDYLRAMQRRYGSDELALAAYNAGPGRVDRALEQARRTGRSWIEFLPAETRNYVPAVMRRTGRE